MNIESYYFPVEEQDIALLDNNPFRLPKINGYKAIISPKEDRDPSVISVVKSSYQLVPNKTLIEPFLTQVSRLGTRWKIDASHSFCQENRMRLQITFPDILLQDEESEIPLSMFLHNSYDQSEGVRLFYGAIRSVCTNGMVFGNILGKFYHRHTSGFSFDGMKQQFGDVTGKIQNVQSRLDYLRNEAATEKNMKDLQKALGKRRMKAIAATDRVPDKSQWELLNDLTYYISHDVEKPKRAELQLKISEVFAL